MLIGRGIDFICLLFFDPLCKEPVAIREDLPGPLLLKIEQRNCIGFVFEIQYIGKMCERRLICGSHLYRRQKIEIGSIARIWLKIGHPKILQSSFQNRIRFVKYPASILL